MKRRWDVLLCVIQEDEGLAADKGRYSRRCRRRARWGRGYGYGQGYGRRGWAFVRGAISGVGAVYIWDYQILH